MKYSDNLPKIEYETTIGAFAITDLTSYFVLNNKNLNTTETELSKNFTLVEMAGNIYGDVNSFWLFLLANDVANPFNLTKEDNANLQKEYSENTVASAITSSGGREVIALAGSIIFPKTNNNGDTYSFGGTGNYSLTGGFALIQSFDSFTKTYTAIQPYSGITFSVYENVIFLINGNTGYYQYVSPTGGDTQYIVSTISQQNSTNKIKYIDSVELIDYGEIGSALPVIQKGSAPYALEGTGQTFSYSQASNLENRNIKYFLPYSVGYFNLTKIIQDYSV